MGGIGGFSGNRLPVSQVLVLSKGVHQREVKALARRIRHQRPPRGGFPGAQIVAKWVCRPPLPLDTVIIPSCRLASRASDSF